jgi:hypothetical protein
MAFLTLFAFSAAAGVLILWIFKLTSNQSALKATRRRVISHLLAMRVYADNPMMILRSQGRLIAWNARYAALLVPSFLAVAIPLYFAWDSLDAIWGRKPFAPGDTAIVTARLRGPSPDLRLSVPPWMNVETPPVRVLAGDEVSWRVRVREAGSGTLSVRSGDARSDLPVTALPGLHYLRERAASSDGPVEYVEFHYPRSAGWIVWFCLISTTAALVARSRLRVTL